MTTQVYQLVLSHDVAVSPEDFAAAWNDLNETDSNGQTQLTQQKGTQYDLSILAGALITIVTNLASSALYDSIKHVIQQLQIKHAAQHSPHFSRHIHIEEMKQPDGTSLLIVDIEEG